MGANGDGSWVGGMAGSGCREGCEWGGDPGLRDGRLRRRTPEVLNRRGRREGPRRSQRGRGWQRFAGKHRDHYRSQLDARAGIFPAVLSASSPLALGAAGRDARRTAAGTAALPSKLRPEAVRSTIAGVLGRRLKLALTSLPGVLA